MFERESFLLPTLTDSEAISEFFRGIGQMQLQISGTAPPQDRRDWG
jgi:hypothetical protein